MLTKGQRRQVKRERISQFAANHGLAYNPEAESYDFDKQLDDIAFYLLEKLELDPQYCEDKNGKFVHSHVSFDDNRYKTFRIKVPRKQREITNFLFSLIRFSEEGGPYEPGDLKALKISRTALNILEATQGEGWQEVISDKIRLAYQENGQHNRSYEILRKDVAFKIALGELMVRAPLGNAVCSNDNIVLRETVLPLVMLSALPGKPVSVLMDGNAYQGAFTDAIIKTAKCEQKTTVIEIQKDIIPLIAENLP